MNRGNWEIISALRDKYESVFSVEVKGMAVCWVYKVEDLDG
jgi:hypothetical protein